MFQEIYTGKKKRNPFFFLFLFGMMGMFQIANAQMVGTPYIPAWAPNPVLCTATSTKGIDFWVSFGNNNNGSAGNVYMQLNISADSATDVTLSFKADGSSTTYNLAANSLQEIDLNNVQGNTPLGDKRAAVYLPFSTSTSGISSNTLHITSTKPISVYAFNTRSATTDASLVLPVEGWGTEYYRLSYQPLNNNVDFEMIIAKEDATVISFPDNSTATLDSGQVYYNLSAADMTGRHITSNKPVAYFTHNTIAQVPTGRSFGDILFEQLLPVSRWGRRFLVPNAPEGSNSMNNHIRVIAAVDGTTVNYSGATPITTDVNNNPIPNLTDIVASGGILNAGEWTELQIDSTNGLGTGESYINTDKPVGVAAYMTGGVNNEINAGDPSIAWMPPIGQSVPHAIIAPFMFQIGDTLSYTNFDGITSNGKPTNVEHYMMIITQTDTKAQTTVNGTAIGSAGWIDNAASGYSYYLWMFDNTLDLSNIFEIANPNGVIVMCGGSSAVETYYYNAGSGTCIIN
jgi:hypothetical protein